MIIYVYYLCILHIRLVKYCNIPRSMSKCFLNGLNVHAFPWMLRRWNVPTNSVLLNSRGGAEDRHRMLLDVARYSFPQPA